MARYVISDTHFGHANILLYELSRLTQMQMAGHNDFDRFLVESWNDRVGRSDRVLHLGDVAFGDGYRYAGKLAGDITLIVGNHDRPKYLEYYKSLGWDVVQGVRIGLKGGERVARQLRRIYGDRCDHPLLSAIVERVRERVVLFSHFPVFDDNPYDEKFADIREMLEFVFVECGCDLNVHGHIHSKQAKEPFCINASVERIGFEPLSLERLLLDSRL